MHAEEVASEIAQSLVLQRRCAHPHVHFLITSLDTQSWFTLEGTLDALPFNEGRRQGYRLAGKLFNLAYAVPIGHRCSDMAARGINLNFKEGPKACPLVIQDRVLQW